MPPEVFQLSHTQAFQYEVLNRAIDQIPRKQLEEMALKQGLLLMQQQNQIRHLTDKVIRGGLL